MVAEGVEGATLFGLAAVSWPVAKRWFNNWGARAAEQDAVWPGDQILSKNGGSRTRAIDINAPASAVWPWILQLGLDKGGFYSYELLERMVGIPVTNIESLETELQHLQIDEQVVVHPKSPPIYVTLVDDNHYVCFRNWLDSAEVQEQNPDTLTTWSLYLEPKDDERCRLLVRSSYEHRRKRRASERLQAALEAPIDFVMEQRLLRTLKRLAEHGVPPARA